MRRREILKTGASVAFAVPLAIHAQAKSIKIGVLNDRSSVYSDSSGIGEEIGVRLAVEDFKGTVLGRPIEIIGADHQNKAEVASEITKKWIDVNGVDAFVAGGSSAAVLAMQSVTRSRGVIANITGPSAVNFTEQDCSPTSFHWQVDTYAMPRASVRASGKANGNWFLIISDYVTGHAVADSVIDAVRKAGGKISGSVKHPLGTTDFASYIAQAQSSKADVIGLVTFGNDLTRALKQVSEFGVREGGQIVVTPYVIFTDLIGAGLENSQGLRFADGYYWNLNDATRAYATRYQAALGKKRPPAAAQANSYAGTLHYLQAVRAAGTTEARAVAAKMREIPVNGDFFKNASIRANGRVVYDLNLVRVKSPGESKSEFDFYDITGSVPGAEAFKPLAESTCKLEPSAVRPKADAR